MSGIIQVSAALCIFAGLAGCVAGIPQDSRLSGPSETDLTHMAGAPGAPTIIARNDASAPGAARSAVRYVTSRLPGARGLRRLQISEIPYLRRSPEGAAFLNSGFPRALARGAPAARCPAAAASPPESETAAAAVGQALAICLPRLSARGADASCGCQVLALNDALVAPRRDFAFAPGVTAFMIRGDRGRIQRLVAESEPTPNGGESVLLRSAAGIVGVLALQDGAAEMRLAADPDIAWRGERRPFGYRRGRLSERITLKADGGRSIRLLVGVETRDAVAAR